MAYRYNPTCGKPRKDVCTQQAIPSYRSESSLQKKQQPKIKGTIISSNIYKKTYLRMLYTMSLKNISPVSKYISDLVCLWKICYITHLTQQTVFTKWAAAVDWVSGGLARFSFSICYGWNRTPLIRFTVRIWGHTLKNRADNLLGSTAVCWPLLLPTAWWMRQGLHKPKEKTSMDRESASIVSLESPASRTAKSKLHRF